MSTKMKVGIAVLVGIFATAIFSDSSTTTTTPVASSAGENDSTTTKSTATKPKTEKKAPPPAPVEDSGDYASISVYTDEVITSSGHIAELLNITGEMAVSFANGEITDSQFIQLLGEVSKQLDGRRSFFAGKEPPVDFASADRLFKQSMDAFDSSIQNMVRCAETYEVSWCEAALADMEQVSTLATQATNALPKG